MPLRVLAVIPERPGGVGERSLHAEWRVRHARRLQTGQQQRHRAARVRAKDKDDVIANVLTIHNRSGTLIKVSYGEPERASKKSRACSDFIGSYKRPCKSDMTSDLKYDMIPYVCEED